MYNNGEIAVYNKHQEYSLLDMKNYNQYALFSLNHSRRMNTLVREATIGVYFKRKDFTPWGANSFFLGKAPFPKVQTRNS